MSLLLEKEEIMNSIKNKKVVLSYSKIHNYINSVFCLNKKIIQFIKEDSVTGFEKDATIGIGSESSGIMKGQGTNPTLWAIGHFCYFYEYHCFKYLIPNYKFVIDDGDLYDSFITSREYRFSYRPHTKKQILGYLDYIEEKLFNILYNIELNETNTYLILLGILHNHMHCESLLFTKKLLGYNSTFTMHLSLDKKFNFEFIEVKGGTFTQGTYEGENLIAFDNEMPNFPVKVKDFKVSKYCVTEKMLLKFLLTGGYRNKKLWSDNGWRWVSENQIDKPFYWIFDDDTYLIKDHENTRPISDVLPACHINYYEAEAICKYFGGRLPLESEWEYIATNGGTTKFPWGNEMISNCGNLNYSGNITDVTDYFQGDNKLGVRQLFGNVWEWCQEPLYPYNGFKIDPVYREFSYPFFGFKKIVRGGCWAVPDILINSRYRNAQMPDCRIQFTGLRIVKS